MSLSVEVGATGRLVDIFVQDATVSTGAGFPNLEISTFSSYYHRSDMTSTSSVTLVSTGTLGTWSSGQWLQVNSTFMRGWYQFACPNGMFAAGSTVALHMYGHPSMAPAVKAIDITRFNLQSATVDANRVGVSSFGLTVGVSSQQVPVDVTSFYASALVTSAAGQANVGRVGVSSFNSPVGVSSFDIRVGVSSFGVAVGVSSLNAPADVTSFFGSRALTSVAGILSVNISTIQTDNAVTTAAGVLGVGRVGVSSFGLTVGISSNPIGVNVTSYRDTAAATTVAGYPATYLDFGLTRNQNSTVAFSSVSWSSQSVTVGSVDVTSFYGSGLVTTAAGILGVGAVGVSSFNLRVGVSSIDQRVGVSSMNIGVDVTSFMGSPGTFTAGDSSVRFSSVSWSSQPVTVGSVDVSSFYGSGLVTTAAGVLAVGRVGVSSFGLTVGVSSFDLRVGVSSFGIAVGVSSQNAPVDVTSFYGSAPITSAAGVLSANVRSINGVTIVGDGSGTPFNV